MTVHFIDRGIPIILSDDISLEYAMTYWVVGVGL